jgi:hypothetical protein
MGNCNFKEKKDNVHEDGKCYMVNSLEKISKSSFNFQYTIGKGGFGKVRVGLTNRFGELRRSQIKLTML